MKTSKVIFLAIIVVFANVGCNKTVDKHKQLLKLKKEQTELTEKIKKLEEQIADEDHDNLKIIQVQVSEVKPQIFKHYIEVQGRVDGDENVTVTAKTMGVITQIFVKPGDIVKKGQTLAEVDAQVLKSTLEELKSSYSLINNLYEKQKALWEQKIGSEVQYLTAKNNKESMEKRIATLQEQIEMTKIVAPINGSVEDVPFKIGQAVSPGITVFRIVNFSKVKVVADIAETYANKVKKDNPLMIYFPDIAKEVEAKVSFASKFISPVNRTFNIEARIDGDNIEYKANMIAIVKINDYLNENAIVVPVNVVQSDPKGKFIYAIENKNNKLIATKRYINEGLSYNGLVEIKNGINFNDKIIISNFQNVDNGVVVKAL